MHVFAELQKVRPSGLLFHIVQVIVPVCVVYNTQNIQTVEQFQGTLVPGRRHLVNFVSQQWGRLLRRYSFSCLHNVPGMANVC